MSAHADTIRDLRYVVAELRTRREIGLADILEAATSEAVAENQRLRDALGGLMEIAETAMPDSYFTTDSRVVAARVALYGQDSE